MTRLAISLSLGCAVIAGTGSSVPFTNWPTIETASAQTRTIPNDSINPFTINIPDNILTDLTNRLAQTRMPDEPDGVDWQLGTNQAYLQQLINYWRDDKTF